MVNFVLVCVSIWPIKIKRPLTKQCVINMDLLLLFCCCWILLHNDDDSSWFIQLDLKLLLLLLPISYHHTHIKQQTHDELCVCNNNTQVYACMSAIFLFRSVVVDGNKRSNGKFLISNVCCHMFSIFFHFHFRYDFFSLI